MPEAVENEFPTILGPDASFNGELSFEKGVRLQGRFQGKITTPGKVHVTKDARMHAEVDAGGITVEGEVKGNLSANDRIELKQSARYEGDLRTSRLVVDEGAVFSGQVTVGPEVMKGRNGAPAGQNAPRSEQAPQQAAQARQQQGKPGSDGQAAEHGQERLVRAGR